MGNPADIKVKLTLDGKEFTLGLDDAKKKLGELGGAAPGTDKLGSSIKGMIGPMIGVAAAAKAISAGFNFLKDSIRLSEQQAKAESRLAQVLKSTKNAAGLTATELKKMASALQDVTTYGDEAIIEGQNILLTFTKIGKEAFPLATEAMLDMTELLGGDMKGAAIQLGKALNDPIKGLATLGKAGVSFSEEQKGLVKTLQQSGDLFGAQKVVLDELSVQFGGQARAAAKTFSGQMQQLNNIMGDNKELIGKELTPVLSLFVGDLTRGAKAGDRLGKSVGEGIAMFLVNIRLIALNISKLVAELDLGYAKISATVAKYDPTVSQQQFMELQKQVLEKRIALAETTIRIGEAQAVKAGIGVDKPAEAPLSGGLAGGGSGGGIAKGAKDELSAAQKIYETHNAMVQEMLDARQMSEREASRARISMADAEAMHYAELDKQIVASKEQSLRAQFGLESRAFQAAKMFANAGMELMNSKNAAAFKVGQAASIANIGMNTAEAIIKGYALMGPVAGSVYAGLMASIGVMQAGNVLKQKPPKPSPKVEVAAPSFAQGVYKIPYDMKGVDLHKGETVMPAPFTEAVESGKAVFGQGGGITINVQGSIIDKDGFMGSVGDALRQMENTTGQRMIRGSVY